MDHWKNEGYSKTNLNLNLSSDNLENEEEKAEVTTQVPHDNNECEDENVNKQQEKW